MTSEYQVNMQYKIDKEVKREVSIILAVTGLGALCSSRGSA